MSLRRRGDFWALATLVAALHSHHVVEASAGDSVNIGTVIGIALGVFIGVASVGAVAVYCWRRWKAHGNSSLDKSNFLDAGRSSDDFDQYFGKMLPPAAADSAKPPAEVVVDINLPKPTATRPSLAHPKQVKWDGVPATPILSVSEHVSFDEPSDTVAAIRSYRSMIQQHSMGEVAWMSPVESSRSMFSAQMKDDDKLEWMSAVESSRSHQIFDTVRSAADLEMDAASTSTINL
ncbi:Aste57867_18100 [Aphanomyces stellatus]|uniref:Aste57867_18100 protein n=1 Tax=Aphanomyces stellatus TaxID=120398 RepID=A0A485LA30_9STRA|nr:hypothetical protein As57867_018038 [Aphanomyces stellatus]VFT94838.1 Aste57867_18100 [Aphanomyces stellatus]